jgi:hypothetical protein
MENQTLGFVISGWNGNVFIKMKTKQKNGCKMSTGKCDVIVWWLLPPSDGGVLAVVDKGQKREDQSPFGSATAWCFLSCAVEYNRLII